MVSKGHVFKLNQTWQCDFHDLSRSYENKGTMVNGTGCGGLPPWVKEELICLSAFCNDVVFINPGHVRGNKFLLDRVSQMCTGHLLMRTKRTEWATKSQWNTLVLINSAFVGIRFPLTLFTIVERDWRELNFDAMTADKGTVFIRTMGI